jgi:hypothetical protein
MVAALQLTLAIATWWQWLQCIGKADSMSETSWLNAFDWVLAHALKGQASITSMRFIHGC